MTGDPVRRLDPLADVTAPRLLGARLRVTGPDGPVTVRITEVEAYLGVGDPGSHACRGETPRTAVMFGPAAHFYVYFTYGMHWCANVVTGPQGVASACLLRGGQVVEGLDLARCRRPKSTDRDLARGPARLASCLGLDRDWTGAPIEVAWLGDDLPDAPAVLQLRARSLPRSRIGVGPRVGVAGPGGDGTAYPLRFWILDDPTVSAYRPGVVRRR